MIILVKKWILLIVGALLLFQTGFTSIEICRVVLVALTFSMLDYYFKNRYFKGLYLGAILILSLIYVEFWAVYPLLIVDTHLTKRHPINGGIILLFLGLFPGENSFRGTVFLLCIISILLLYFENKWQEARRLQILAEDNLNEVKFRLTHEKKELMTVQEAEVYYATLKERGRIAREIHDSTGHLLSAGILQMGAIKTVNKDENLSPLLDNLEETLHKGMDSMRSSVHENHAKSFDFEKELSQIIDQFEFCPLHFSCNISNATSTKIKITFLNVVKEALTNIAKHSNASMVKISVLEKPSLYQLIISDNGTSLVKSTNSGLGIINMKEQVDSLNGVLNIDKADGFKIHISVLKE